MFKTELVKIDRELIDKNNIKVLMKQEILEKAAALLSQGEVVAFPTETVYGLGADATNERAVQKIFAAKGRPQDNPLIVHLARLDQLEGVVSGGLSQLTENLVSAFWPGPLTIIMPRSELIPDVTTAGLDSVAVRMPAHPVARALIGLLDRPVAAPSANSSGFPSPTMAEHVYNDLQEKIPLIIDGGPCQVGLESTVIDIREDIPVILRPGGISREEIENVLQVEVLTAGGDAGGDNMAGSTPPSPGMKYRHYSPAVPLKLLTPDDLKRLMEILEGFKSSKLALVLTDETASSFENNLTTASNITPVRMGSVKNMKEIARNLFAILRQLDREELDLILIESVPEKGIGAAVMNRLHKAAANDIYLK